MGGGYFQAYYCRITALGDSNIDKLASVVSENALVSYPPIFYFYNKPSFVFNKSMETTLVEKRHIKTIK